MIICIEGMDASGKATQTKILAAAIGADLFSFPDYSTPAGEVILGNLKNQWYVTSGWDETESGGDPYIRKETRTNALVLQSLMAVNRLERGAELRESARRGHVVLDRYDASAMVYGGLDGLDPKWVELVNTQLPVRPELYIFLDIPVEESWKRRPERRDRYEKDRTYLERVRESYLSLFAEGQKRRMIGGGPMPRWRVVDGMGTVTEVSNRIADAVGALP